MSILTFQDFSIGKDLRKGKSVADANRLRELKNGYVTSGKAVKKRPGTILFTTLEPGSKGLIPGLGVFNTFAETSMTHANSLFTSHQVAGSNVDPAAFTGSGLNDVSSGGGYTGTGTPTFTVEIEAVVSGSITIMASGANTTITSAGHPLANGNIVNISGTTSYNGEFTVSAVTTDTFSITATFVADDGTGAWEKLNTFKWKKDSGTYTTGVAITGAAQTLQEGVQITFGAKFGHIAADVWAIAISGSITTDVVHYGDVFNGFLYVAVEYSNDTIIHHYLDGTSPSKIADVNCPNSKGVIKMEEKIWAINGSKVNFSATGIPRDWTTGSDAGNLPVGLRQRGSDTALALGQYKESNLVVFFRDGAQLWAVDPDPASHTFKQSLFGSQSQYHMSVSLLFQDMYFLSDYGFRSISEAVLTESQAEIDIGTPVDEVVLADLPPATTDTPRAVFNPSLGQYMCAIGTTIYVFTVSKTAKITAWAEYEMPWTVTDMAVLNTEVYIRNADDIYKFDATTYRDGVETGKAITAMADAGGGFTTITSAAHGRTNDDEVIIAGTTNYNGTFLISGVTTNTFNIVKAFVANEATGTYTAGTIFEFEMEMAYVDAKRPAELKQWFGIDTVTAGTGRISFKYDPRNEDLVTSELSLTDDTRPGTLSPVEVVSVNIAPVIKNNLNEAFQVDALSLHFEKLGNM